jgi:hypothetical protein
MPTVILMPAFMVLQRTRFVTFWSWPSIITLFCPALAVPDAAAEPTADALDEELVVALLLEHPANAAARIADPATPILNRCIIRISFCSAVMRRRDKDLLICTLLQMPWRILGGFARRSEPGNRSD